MGMRSFSLLTRVKFPTCESKNDAQALLPTRGVPYVTPEILVPDGRLRVKNSESSSANAPPVVRYQVSIYGCSGIWRIIYPGNDRSTQTWEYSDPKQTFYGKTAHRYNASGAMS
jgi:hypothetical protein